jgi:hypothetical protein
MMSDHFPYNVVRALQCCTDAYGVDDQDAIHEIGGLEQILEGAKKDL